jgi:hypothetical protein
LAANFSILGKGNHLPRIRAKWASECGGIVRSHKETTQKSALDRNLAIDDTWVGPVPISTAELDAIEDHLGDLLDSLLGSPEYRRPANDWAPVRRESR